jgi:glycosyltransferase involved in cell wall biosynthesis
VRGKFKTTPINDEVLGLFPYFGPETVGGIQASARIAWSAVAAWANGGASIIGYANGGVSPTTLETNQRMLIVGSRGEAIRKVVTRKWPQHLVFVWHLNLLKLLPFLRLSQPRVIVMLLGIEAWKEHKGLTARQLDRVDLFLSISSHTWLKFVECNRRYEQKPHRKVLLGIGKPIKGSTPRPAQPPIALIVSRLLQSEDYKGHRELIDAWPLVLRNNRAAELWIAGDGDLRPKLENWVRSLRLQNSIKFFGQVSEQKKQELLTQSRCLVMPSRREGFGLVYLEAMRLGRPCLVSTLDAGREVVNPPEGGLAVNPADRQAVADAVSRLISTGDEWERWSEQARRRYESNFTAAHFQRRLLAALFHPEV